MRKIVVVALGGSIIHPDGIDVAFLKKFKKFLVPYLRHGMKFVLVIGGGNLARHFQDAAHKVSRLTDEDKDWIGIHATRLNGHLIRTIFREVADPVMIDARHKLPRLARPLTVAAGWRPGWSQPIMLRQRLRMIFTRGNTWSPGSRHSSTTKIRTSSEMRVPIARFPGNTTVR